MNIKEAVSLHRFGLVTSEQIVNAAIESLANDDSETLLMLASEVNKQMHIIEPLLYSYSQESGLAKLTLQDHSIIASKYFIKLYELGQFDEESLGFKIGTVCNYEEAPSVLREIYLTALAHDECATEFGYPSDWQSYRNTCLEDIRKLVANVHENT